MEAGVTMDSDEAKGQKIGNYIVRYKLGEGGMGLVYLAEHSSIGKKVAIKLLRRDLASQAVLVDRFFSEAKVVNDIKHENVIDVFDFGMVPPPRLDQSPMVYLIMELLEGESLSALIGREAPLPPERAIRIAIQIANALSAAHRARIIHRDLKPDNVMLIQRRRTEDFVKVLDFGIAKQIDRATEDPWTISGVAIGTPQYMSPEQCRARRDIDSRTDIYSLGIVLYEMLTGVVPFDGDGFGDVLFHQTTIAPRAPTRLNPRIPISLEQVVLKALEKNASDRYQSMNDLIAALEASVSHAESALRAVRIPDADPVAPVLAMPMPAKPVPASPVLANPGVVVERQLTKPSPVNAARALSSSVAQFGGALALRRRRGFVMALLGIACAAIGATQLAGTKRPEMFAKRYTTAQSTPASGPRFAAAPDIQMEPVIENKPTLSTTPAANRSRDRHDGGPAPPEPGSMVDPAREPTPAAQSQSAATPVELKRVRLEIRSTPPKATVWLDGVARGVTPYRGEVEGGNMPVEIRLALAGYESMDRRLVQRADGAHTFVLQPQRQRKIVNRGDADLGSRDGIKNPFAGIKRQVLP
jgi:serine/threonine-protein kinase